MNKTLTLLAALALLALPPAAAQSPLPIGYEASPKHEYRAVWLTTIGGLDWPRTPATTPARAQQQRQELTEMLDSLKSLGINTVLLQTRIRGDVIYPSGIEPFNYIFTGKEGQSPGYDPLAFAIDECHRRGMQLHAWMVTLPLGDGKQVAKQGKNALCRKRPELCRQHDGSWYMEPAHPQTADYLCSIVREVLSRYDVDGIHFDYIRYPDRPARYPDDALYRKQKSDGQSKSEWRRQNISTLAQRLYAEAKSAKPWVCVSCSPLGKYRDTSRYSSRGWNAYGTVHQEALEWLNGGYMDALFPMLYFSGNDFHPFLLQWGEERTQGSIAAGIGIYRLESWPLDELKSQLQATRKSGTQGQCYFRARHLIDNLKGANDFIAHFYRHPALVPPLPGKQPTPQAPGELRIVDSGMEQLLSWGAPPDSQQVSYTVYADTLFPVDTERAENIVATGLSDTHLLHGAPARQLHYAVTAINRYGIESEATQYRATPPHDRGERIELPPTAQKGHTIAIYTATGQLIAKCKYAPQINLEKMPVGHYLIKVLDPKGNEICRLPVKRP